MRGSAMAGSVERYDRRAGWKIILIMSSSLRIAVDDGSGPFLYKYVHTSWQMPRRAIGRVRRSLSLGWVESARADHCAVKVSVGETHKSAVIKGKASCQCFGLPSNTAARC